jgi:hypothetical protein
MCPKDDPCEVHHGFTIAAANDEVIITAGDYGSASAPLSGAVTSSQTGLNVHGEDGKPRPRIFLDTGNDTSGLSLTGAGTKARHFEVHHHASLGSRQAAFTLDNAEATDVVARIVSPQGKACVVLHASLLTNSLCEATATNAFGIATHTGVGPGEPNNSVLRNVTAIAAAAGSNGIHAFGGNDAADDQNLTVTNAIARGCPACADVAADNAPGGFGTAIVTIDHSNFGFEGALPAGSGDRVVDGPGGGNQRFIAVNFVAADDFHQAAGSPTIDKGTTNVLNGPADFDGDPRALGQGTDMGADEFVPPPTAVTGAASAVTTSSGVLNATVNPNAVATTYHFEYGLTSAYGSSTPETDAGAGAADLAAAATLTGLARSTTYHFRIVATSRGGTTVGADRTLTTNGPGGPLLSLDVSPRKFVAAGGGGSVRPAARKRRRVPVGTTVTFRLNEAAKVLFKVERALPGRRAGGRCGKPSKRNRRARKCTRFARMPGSFSFAGAVGENRFRFMGRLRKHKLAPGSYRLVATAEDGRLTTRFKIVRH